MNAILLGGVFLGAALLGAGVPKALVEAVSAPAQQQPVQKPGQNVEPPVQRTAEAPSGESPDRGWMTREIHVDQKTGETTEVSVIGFAD
jgi:hypothetical protein